MSNYEFRVFKKNLKNVYQYLFMSIIIIIFLKTNLLFKNIEPKKEIAFTLLLTTDDSFNEEQLE